VQVLNLKINVKIVNKIIDKKVFIYDRQFREFIYLTTII
jgi:hypothetical protein